MLHETIQLFEDKDVSLVTYLHNESKQRDFQIHKRPAIIVLPGGAYSFLSDPEGEPVALTFMKEGYNTFVLNYTVGDDCQYPDILIEISKAILTVRENAEKWNIDPHAIILMGFSAGACLAGMSATQWNAPEVAQALHVDSMMLKPDACVIGYGAWDNANTIQHDPQFFNPNAAKIAQECTPQLDLINYVGKHVPPMFIWHNFHDKYVPASNPLMIASAMYEQKIPVELHLFAYGEHGMSVCNHLSSYNEKSYQLVKESPNVYQWVDMAVNWINKQFEISNKLQ